MIKNFVIDYVKKIKHSNNVSDIYKKYFKGDCVTPVFTHKNDVYVVYKKKEKLFRKFSITKNGAKKIKNDYNGLKWYCSKKKIITKKIIQQYVSKNKFSYIDTTNIKGTKIKSWLPLSKNYIYIKRSLDHYTKIFNKQKKMKIHGDLTLENIFFKNKNVFFIDWEFFNSKKSWGYDAVYLVLSSVSLPFIANETFSNKDKHLFKNLWKQLIEMPINQSITRNPYEYFIKAIKSDKVLNKSRLISERKFFPLITPKKFQNKIISIINSEKL